MIRSVLKHFAVRKKDTIVTFAKRRSPESRS